MEKHDLDLSTRVDMDMTPNAVLSLKKPPEQVYSSHQFLCGALGYTRFQFLEFQIFNDKTTYYHIQRPEGPIDWNPVDESRIVEYTFPKSFLDTRSIRTKLVFAVGPTPIEQLRLIELHYSGKKLIRSYDFTFGFCIPGTVNTWESEYEMPTLSKQESIHY
jgi:hypothetical protein